MRAFLSVFVILCAPPVVANSQGNDESSFYLRRSVRRNGRRGLLTYVKNAAEGDILGHCEGDCDKDSHCAGNLICFNRTKKEPVPGCPGGEQENSETDYCIRAEDLPAPSSQPPPPPPPSPLPTPTAPSQAAPSTDSAYPPLSYAYNVNLAAGDLPIGHCQGDCDVDEHCMGILVCFQRNGNQPVPGCSGGVTEPSVTDYCVHPDDIANSPVAPVANPNTAPVATSTAPVTAPTVPVPSTVSSASSPTEPAVTLLPGTEPYALLPADFPRLDLCEGNCHMDSDCKPGLWCNQREPFEDVPGCSGGSQDASNYDYCTYVPPTLPPTPMPAPFPAPTDTSFRLKMHWEPHYFWQEELFDRMWCMACKDGCAVGHSMHITRCSGESAYLNFVSVAPNPAYPHRDKPEVLIRVDGTDLCFELDEQTGSGWPEFQPITLQPCVATKFRQRWFANDGSFEGPLMEISQYGRIHYCISQQHFPKYGELVRIEQIAKARFDTTSYWLRY